VRAIVETTQVGKYKESNEVGNYICSCHALLFKFAAEDDPLFPD